MNSNESKIHTCKRCGRRLKNWKSIQKGLGIVCERKYLDEIYTNQQISIETVLQENNRREERQLYGEK